MIFPIYHTSRMRMPIAPPPPPQGVSLSSQPQPSGSHAWRWRVERVLDTAGVLIPPPDEPPPSVAPSSSGPTPPPSKSIAVYLRGCQRSSVSLEAHFKALLVEGCERTTTSLLGVVASVELLRCSRCTLLISGPVSCVRVDDCNDVTIELSYAAWRGFQADGGGALVEGGDPRDEESGSCQSEGGGAAGFHVYATGSHGVRVSHPISDAPNAPRREWLVPEVVHTRFGEGLVRPASALVDSSKPWGVVPGIPGHR